MTDDTTTTTNGRGGDSVNNNILSEKVSRALQVRTDTPAMKAALEALSNLPSSTMATNPATTPANNTTTTDGNKGPSSSSFFTVDSRSVRMAIEQDALSTTLQLQEELRNLVTTITQLREGVAETAAIADRVRRAIHTPVMTAAAAVDNKNAPQSQSSSETPTAAAEGEEQQTTDPATAASAATPPVSSGGGAATTTNKKSSSRNNPAEDALRLEIQLAAQLSDAFMRRDQAKKRLEAVQSFLEKFNLNEEDSRLLDHYSFEDMEQQQADGDEQQQQQQQQENSKPVNGLAFLAALERTRKIRSTLEHTTLADDHHRLGASSALRMMETLAQKQEQAYERLYHWLQTFLNLHASSSSSPSKQQQQQQQNKHGGRNDGEDEIDRLDELLSHPFVKRALYTLRHVPAFYSHTIELIASSRRGQETKRFLLALTSGHQGFPPIEMKAHDPVVYVGDMLAFCFKAFSVEADVAKGLIQYRPEEEDENNNGDNNDGDDGENDNDSRENDDDEGEEKRQEDEENNDDAVLDDGLLLEDEKPFSARDMLAVSMSGVARPLKSRIFQVVATLARRPDEDEEEEDAIQGADDFDEGSAARTRVAQLYDICGLLLFYASVIDTVVHKVDGTGGPGGGGGGTAAASNDNNEKNPLVKAILDCLAECTNAYEATFRVYCAMLDQLSVLTGESESNLVHRIAQKLSDVRIASPGFSKDVPCPESFQTILSMEWMAETLLLSEAALPCCKTLDDAVTLKRSIMAANRAGMSIVVASQLNEKVDEKEAALIDRLVEKETHQVLEYCGLGPLATAWKSWQRVRGGSSGDEDEATVLMATYPGLAAEDVDSCMKDFYTSLYSPPISSLEDVVKDPLLRKSARKKIAEGVCRMYEDLYNAMTDKETSGYDDLGFLGHTPQQVRTLFSS